MTEGPNELDIDKVLKGFIVLFYQLWHLTALYRCRSFIRFKPMHK